MPCGVPLTPDQLEQAAAVYKQTGNYSEAARAIGVSEAAVRQALARLGCAKRHDLNARAIDRGLRLGRKRLHEALEQGQRFLDAVDGKEYAAVVGAIARATEAILKLDERGREVAQGRLTRNKTRAEITLLKAKAAGDVSDTTIVMSPGDKAFEQLMIEKWGGLRQTTPAKSVSETSDGSGSSEGMDRKPVP